MEIYPKIQLIYYLIIYMSYYIIGYSNQTLLVDFVQPNQNKKEYKCDCNSNGNNNNYNQLSSVIDSPNTVVSIWANSSLPSIPPGSTSIENTITPITNLLQSVNVGSTFSLNTVSNGPSGTNVSYIIIKTSMSNINFYVDATITIKNPSSTNSNSGEESLGLYYRVGGVNGPIYPLHIVSVPTNSSGGSTDISIRKYIYGGGIKSGDALFFAVAQNTVVLNQNVTRGTFSIELK
jgi:hypothetical protein